MGTDDALLDLIGFLKQRDYHFHAVTPATHARVLARPASGPPTLRDVFGWSRPFAEKAVPLELLDLMRRAEILRSDADGLRSEVRVASLGGDLFLHSAYPTDEADAVFFGPDTYRFARFIRDRWPAGEASLIADMGAGSGAGGIVAARRVPGASIALVDVNPKALRLAKINALAAGVVFELRQQSEVPAADVVLANPPYLMDPKQRAYRDGGEKLGGAVALEWVQDALRKLPPGAAMLLYTGAAIVGGTSPLMTSLQQVCDAEGASLEIEEIDPDVFGEELEREAYSEVERIAAIGAIIRVA